MQESSLNPKAFNPKDKHKGCMGSYGLMQIGCIHYPENPEALYDLDFNLKKARYVYETQGLTAWGAWTDGKYKNHLHLFL